MFEKCTPLPALSLTIGIVVQVGLISPTAFKFTHFTFDLCEYKSRIGITNVRVTAVLFEVQACLMTTATIACPQFVCFICSGATSNANRHLAQARPYELVAQLVKLSVCFAVQDPGS